MSESALKRLRGLRIAHLIESSGPGGAERVVAYLACRLQELGARNFVILPAAGPDWLASQLSGSGVAIESIDLRLSAREAVRDLTGLFRLRAFDLAHSHEFRMGVYGAWAARRTGAQHLITLHGRRYYADRVRRRVGLRLAIALSGKVVAVSEQLKRHLCRDLWVSPSRVAMIWNGVPSIPATTRSTLREELRLKEEDRLLLAVGNLYPVKGHVYLLEALSLLAERMPRVHVAIAGRGQMAESLAARACDLGVADRFHLLGLRSDIPNLLAGADVFVHPSLAEGLPLAVLEAMHAGCPIISSAVGEIPNVLAHGAAGILVEAGNPPALADAVLALLENPSRADELARSAAQRAATDFDLAAMTTRYGELYCALLAERRADPQPGDRAHDRALARP